MRYYLEIILTLTALLVIVLSGSALGQAELVQHHGNIVLGQIGTTTVQCSNQDYPLVTGFGIGIWGRLSLGFRSTSGQYFPYDYWKTEKYAEALAIRTGKSVRFSLGLRVAEVYAGGFRHGQGRLGTTLYFEADPIRKVTMTAHYRIMLYWDKYDTKYWYHKNIAGLGANTLISRNILLRGEWEIEATGGYHSSSFFLGMGLVLPQLL
ncbi:MAG: hypothetical protein WAU88_06185 [Candidatus Zixiibacteriota bacterium]